MRPRPREVPSPPTWGALGRVALYWLLWLLVVRRLLQSDAATLSTLGWIVAATAVTAWFSWIRLHDDKQARARGPGAARDDEEDRGTASPERRALGAAVLAAGGLCHWVGAILVPEMRSTLLLIGCGAFVAAVLVLFFGRR